MGRGIGRWQSRAEGRSRGVRGQVAQLAQAPRHDLLDVAERESGCGGGLRTGQVCAEPQRGHLAAALAEANRARCRIGAGVVGEQVAGDGDEPGRCRALGRVVPLSGPQRPFEGLLGEIFGVLRCAQPEREEAVHLQRA